MKKLIIIGSLFIFVFLVLFIISRDHTTDLNIIFVDEIEQNDQEFIKTCVQRNDGKLVLVNVEKKTNENIYLYALKLYDHYRNSLPLTYITPLNGNFEVKMLEKKGDKIQLELEVLYLVSDFNRFLTALMWTYQNLGINEMSVKANNETFNLKKNNTINLIDESSFEMIKRRQVILYYEEEEVVPVTYLHNSNKIDFLMNKILSKYPNVSYTYEEYDQMFILRIEDPKFELNKAIIDCLFENIINLNSYKDIIIIKNELVVRNN